MEAVSGMTAAGFEGVRVAFEQVVALDDRGGSALSVMVDGQLVVELVAGSGANPATPRRPGTLQVSFSCTKAMVATVLLQLIEQERLELDAPMARYWPEFAEHGKGDLLVRHVVSHMAGQPAFRTPVSAVELADDATTEAAVARDEPWWPAGTALAYHALTYGALCGGLIRRITGEPVGVIVRREIAARLGLDLWIGLPDEREQDVAPLFPIPPAEEDTTGTIPALRARIDNPPVLAGPGGNVWNSRRYHAGEIPGANGITSATALARMYGCLALGGSLDGATLLRPETIELGRTQLAAGRDALTGDGLAFGVGYMLPAPAIMLGSDPNAFGHAGHGGQAAGAWPQSRTGFAYLTTAMRGGTLSTERSLRLLTALEACV